MKKFPTLYKKDSKGNPQMWEILVRDTTTINLEPLGVIKITHGKVGGKLQITEDFIKEGKNIGKANATTAYEQACLEAESKWIKKQERKGYVLSPEATEQDSRPGAEPMLEHRFVLARSVNGFPAGRYSLDMRDGDYTPVRTASGIGEELLLKSSSRALGSALVHFQLSSRKAPVAQVQQLDGQSGVLTAGKIKSQSFGFEEQIVFAGITDLGEVLDAEVIEKMFRFSASVQNIDIPKEKIAQIEPLLNETIAATTTSIKNKNQAIFESEIDRLDKWADDVKLSLELEIKALDREIRQAKADAKKKQLLDEKVEAQKQVKALEAKRNDKRRQLFEAQDQIEAEKDQLLEKIESNLEPKVEFEPLFTVQWKVS